MILRLPTTTIMATISGTATMPLTTALQNSIRIGSSGVSAAPSPASVAAGDDQIKARRAARRQFQAAFPAEAFRHRIAGGTGQHRHREQAGADDAERKQKKRQRPGQRPQRFGGLRGGADLVMPWACSVAAVVTMMKKPMMFDSIMPVGGVEPDAKRLRVAPGAWCERTAAALVPALLRSLRSSASSEACQKNIYGLIVVPKIATSISM